MEHKISWYNCRQVIMSIQDDKLKSLDIRLVNYMHIDADIKDFDTRINNEIFYVKFDHEICQYLYIKGLNFVKALEIVKDYVDNMGIQYDAEIFGDIE